MVAEYVIKRDGRQERVDLKKITARLQRLKEDVSRVIGRELQVDVSLIESQIRLINNISTREIDRLSASVSSNILLHSDYFLFAGCIMASDLQSTVQPTFVKYVRGARHHSHVQGTEQEFSLLSAELERVVELYGDLIDAKIVPERDFQYDFMAMKTLMDGQYLVSRPSSTSRTILETPQYMWMRVALGLYADRILADPTQLQTAFTLYEAMSNRRMTMATPTLFSAGLPNMSLISCFLVFGSKDSLQGIYETLTETAMISKNAGGVGVSVHGIRGEGAYIRGTNGRSNGLGPMLRVFNATARYVDQGGGKRPGSVAVYLETHHPDLMTFLDLKMPTAPEKTSAKELFYALWVSDLFMDRFCEQAQDLSKEVTWSFFDSTVAPELMYLVGDEYKQRYLQLEEEKKYVRQVDMRMIMQKLVECWKQTGTPYLLNKDQCNRKSNQKNLGTITSSNLCAEIVEFSSEEETACCNLASICLQRFVTERDGQPFYDFEALAQTARIAIEALDHVIDVSVYPSEKARRSNMNHRPVGLGIQGLADTFYLMGYNFGSKESRKLNRQIMETIQFASLSASHDLAKRYGRYSSFEGSPASQGLFQHDLWDPETIKNPWSEELGLDWSTLKENVMDHGLRNSLVTALMPTASTALIMGSTANCFEPFSHILVMRANKSGDFGILNPLFVREMEKRGLWTLTKDSHGNWYSPWVEHLKKNGGKLNGIPGIPEDVVKLFRTVHDIPVSVLIKMDAERGPFVDQSQSSNRYFLDSPTYFEDIIQAVMCAHMEGLKTLGYYWRVESRGNVPDYASSSTDGTCTSCQA